VKNILDRYRVLKQVSSGEHTVVWLAQHRSLDCKRIVKGIRKSSPLHNMLKAEAQTLKELEHQGIPSVYDVDSDSEFTYIIEEYIEGETLRSFYLNKKVSQEQFLAHTQQICSILEYLHDRSIAVIHMDLKPDNIIIGKRVYLVDFGSSIVEGNRQYLPYGTKGYCAPECMEGQVPGRESDIYSLGRLLTFMMQHSLTDKKTEKKIGHIIRKCLKPDRDIRISNGLIITRMLKKVAAGEAPGKRCTAKRTGRIFAVVGLSPGSGATFVAVSLASFLSQKEKVTFVTGGSRGVCDMHILKEITSTGVGAGIEFVRSAAPEGTKNTQVVIDFGSDPVRVASEALTRCDTVLFVGGAAPWRSGDYDFIERLLTEGILEEKPIVLVNMGNEKTSAGLLPDGMEAYVFPYEKDPVNPGVVTRKLFGKIVGRS